MSVEHLVFVCITFVLGGILKGATGVGAPLIAISVMALLVDLPFAVSVFLVPNIVSNIWQTWRFRKDRPEGKFPILFAVTGILGAGIGTMVLAGFNSDILIGSVAMIVLLYVAFKLANPNWAMSWNLANKLVVPVGLVGGFLQGSTGLSAPISVTFMNAVNLQRAQFIFTMSLFFLSMTLIQFPAQYALGILTLERFIYGVVAVIPLFIGMSIGGYLGKRISKPAFDKIIIIVLSLLALRLLVSVFYG